MIKRKIVLAGGTGNIGQLLIADLIALGYEIHVLTRSNTQIQDKNINYVHWDGEHIDEWINVLEGIDTLINLSGKSIQCRFTEKNKKELLESRLFPTRILGEAIQRLHSPPRLWINFSGISIFEGLGGQYDEDSTASSTTFLAGLTKSWEKVFFEGTTSSTMKVCLRLSPVLSPKFGMFKELYPLTKMGLGGKVGDGKQMISWIHELDLLNLVKWLINHNAPSKLYHACAPLPVSNEIFMRDLRQAAGIKLGLPLPKLFAKIGAYFKGVESGMLLRNNSVYAKRPIQEGFEYHYPTTPLAFENLTNII